MPYIIYFNLLILLVVFLTWLGLIFFLRMRKQKSYQYLALFTLFFIYIVKVLDYTLFQFQSLLLLKYFLPNLMMRGQTADKALNLIPLITLTSQDLKTSLLNILLMIPFGFGLPFMSNFRMKKIVLIGFCFSLAIELTQLLTGVLAKTTFRVADVNDLIFNTLGVVIGYLLFLLTKPLLARHLRFFL